MTTTNITARTRKNRRRGDRYPLPYSAGLDDGPQTMDLSLAMAEMAVEDGIEVIIATPHADGELITPARLDAAVRDLNRELIARHIPLTVVPGFEIPHYLALDLAATHTLAGSRLCPGGISPRLHARGRPGTDQHPGRPRLPAGYCPPRAKRRYHRRAVAPADNGRAPEH